MKKKKNTNLHIELPSHLAIYVRVSTEKQVNTGVSIENQRERGIEKANQLGWTYSIYDDSGMSGSLSYFERPGIKRLIQDLDNNKIGGLYSFNIDRWSRDPTYVEPQVLITKFIESKIKVFTTNGELDLSNPAVAMTARLQGFFASFERLQTKERVISSLIKSVKSGNNAGGGQMVLYGYDRVNKKLVINTEQADIVKKIFCYYLEGHGTKVISNMLNTQGIKTKRNLITDGRMTIKKSVRNNESGKYEIVDVVKKGGEFVWRDTVIYNMLKNTTYIGKKKWSDFTIDAPQIIDTKDFEAVQIMLTEKMRFKRAPYSNVGKKINNFLLKGMVKCANCGKGYYGHKRADLKDNAYKCLSQRYKNGWCGNRGISIDFLDNLVWEAILSLDKKITSHVEVSVRETDRMFRGELNHYSSEVIKHKQFINDLTEKYVEGKIKQEVYDKLLKKHEDDIARLEYDILKINKTFYFRENKELFFETMKQLRELVEKADTIEKRQNIIRTYISQVTIVTLKYKDFNTQNIKISYKLSELRDYYIQDQIDVSYKNNWHRIHTETKPFRILPGGYIMEREPIEFDRIEASKDFDKNDQLNPFG